jgi:hypothetical protein
MVSHEKCSQIVEAIGQIAFEGNIIPDGWFTHTLLKNKKSGRTNINAIVLLSDVIYWYRPLIVRDEATGKVVCIKQKFKADMLQMSYQAWADKFGLTRREVKNAVSFLKQQGLLKVQHRTVKTESGTRLGNVTFVEPIPNKIREITYLPDPHTSKRARVTPSKVQAHTSKGVTNTETTTENTNTDIKENIYRVAPASDSIIKAALLQACNINLEMRLPKDREEAERDIKLALKKLHEGYPSKSAEELAQAIEIFSWWWAATYDVPLSSIATVLRHWESFIEFIKTECDGKIPMKLFFQERKNRSGKKRRT